MDVHVRGRKGGSIHTPLSMLCKSQHTHLTGNSRKVTLAPEFAPFLFRMVSIDCGRLDRGGIIINPAGRAAPL